MRILVLLVAVGCSEQEFNVQNLPDPVGDLVVTGRVCDPLTQTWLENALVYTHLYDDNDIVYDSRSDYTDAEGRYELADLVADKDYEIYTQVGHDIIDKFILGLGTEDVVIPDPPCSGTPDLNVAVITGAYDDLAPMLEAIGVTGTRVIDGQAGTEIVDFLTDPVAMADYDVIFFDGGHREDGVVYGTGPIAEIHDAIRGYVEAGGVVFASDWAYDVIEQVWPDQLEFAGDDLVPDAAQIGEIGLVGAEIVDPGLAETIQLNAVEITYDLPVWPVIEGAGAAATIYLQGDAPWRQGLASGTQLDAPLLVGFEDGEGRVLFTTYRNSANNNTAMLGVLITLMDAIVQAQ